MSALIRPRAAMLRRVILLGLAILVASLASNAASPATADAFFNDNRVTASHSGWVFVRSSISMCGLATCVGNPVPAWRWSGSTWSQSSVLGGAQVYAYPYTGSWHWIWTQRGGWLAIETAKLERNRYSCSYVCA